VIRNVPGVLAVLVIAGCRRDPNAPPPCGAVGAKLLVLARAELDAKAADGKPKHVDATRRAVLDQLPAMRDALVNACTDTQWSGAVRRCLADAPDHVAFEACQQQLTDPQRKALEASPAPSRP
jgi:hypothetical protein